MDVASLHRMAARVSSGSPPADPLYELVELVAECRLGIERLATDYMNGRVSEEAYMSLSRGVNEAARSACDALRSKKNSVDSVLTGRITP